MRCLRFVAVGVVALFCALSPAKAAQDPQTSLPNTLTIGGGWQELYNNTPYKNGGDFRLEHRWGMSLLSSASDSFDSWDSVFQIHPFAGIETTTNVEFYAFGGLILDFLIGRYIVISPNFAVGYFSEGSGKHLGCPLEFRSTMEIGTRFDNGWRVSLYAGHMSNANLGDHNPGVEHGGLYIHIPLKP